MNEEPYKNREVDEKFEQVHTRFTTQDATLARIEKKLDFTNGKVKKIILALVAVAALSVGMGFDNVNMLLTLFL